MAGQEEKKTGKQEKSKSVSKAISNFRTFFNTIDHMLGVIDMDGIFIEMNKAGLSSLGYKIEDLRGKDANILFPADVHEEITKKFIKVKEKGSGSWSYPIVTNSGHLIPSEIIFHRGDWDSQEAYFVVANNISQKTIVSEARKVSLRILNAGSNGEIEQIFKMAMSETLRLTQSRVAFFGDYNEKDSSLDNLIWISDKSSENVDNFPKTFVLGENPGLKKQILAKKTIFLPADFFTGIMTSPFTLGGGMLVPLIDGESVKYIVGFGREKREYNNLDKNIISILWDNVESKVKRVNARIALQENEFEYRNLFDSSRDALMLYDLEFGKIVLCNKMSVKMFGYKNHAEMLNKTPLDLSVKYQPDGSLSAKALQTNPSTALTERVYVPYWVHVRKNGEEFPCEVNLSPINYKGKKIVLANVRDISEKVKIESELERSEQSISLAIKEAELGIWDYNCISRMMTVGKGFSKILMGSLDSLIFSVDKWLSIIHPEDRQRVTESFADHIEGKSKSYRNEYRIISETGEPRWILASGSAIERDDKGKAKRVVGILMDINNSKKLSRQVEDTRNFLETIISNIESILFVKDSKGRYLLVNKALTNKFKIKEKDILGKTRDDLDVLIDFDTPLSDEIVIKQGIDQTYEHELRLSDGKLHDYLVTKIPIRDAKNEVYAQVGLATDISHIKKLEKELRNNVFSLDAAINGTGSGLWDWNPKTDELILNDNWFQMLGYTRSYFNKKYKKFGFKTFADFIHPEDVIMVGKELEKHYRGETDYYQAEIRMLTSENKWKWILASGKVWEWDKEHNPLRMVGIHVDIDIKIRTAEHLKRALEKAEESDRLKSAFLANMSHEIRTPMNGIIGFLDLLENNDIPTPQRNEYMNIIRSSSIQLLNIVNDIVDISKIESGQVTVRESAFDIKELFDEIRMQYRPVLDEKHLYFEVDCQLSDQERNLKTDHTKLRQVLSNLVSNAIKFTNEGGIKLTCKKKGDFLEICIADTGMGIQKKIQKKVFERFIQADMGLARIQEGTGLGLSICKAYVEKLGGKIWLESDPGKGSRFYFTIPCKASEADIEENNIEEDHSIDPKARLILVVEDEIYNFLFVEQVLRNRGWNVIHAESGQIALDIIEKSPQIGLVLMDIRMPLMDGYETTRRLKKIRPELPVVALTALALSGDREKAIEAGCDDYLKKPVLREELITLINKILSE